MNIWCERLIVILGRFYIITNMTSLVIIHFSICSFSPSLFYHISYPIPPPPRFPLPSFKSGLLSSREPHCFHTPLGCILLCSSMLLLFVFVSPLCALWLVCHDLTSGRHYIIQFSALEQHLPCVAVCNFAE